MLSLDGEEPAVMTVENCTSAVEEDYRARSGGGGVLGQIARLLVRGLLSNG